VQNSSFGIYSHIESLAKGSGPVALTRRKHRAIKELPVPIKPASGAL
jgi:hypothetical protein